MRIACTRTSDTAGIWFELTCCTPSPCRSARRDRGHGAFEQRDDELHDLDRALLLQRDGQRRDLRIVAKPWALPTGVVSAIDGGSLWAASSIWSPPATTAGTVSLLEERTITADSGDAATTGGCVAPSAATGLAINIYLCRTPVAVYTHTHAVAKVTPATATYDAVALPHLDAMQGSGAIERHSARSAVHFQRPTVQFLWGARYRSGCLFQNRVLPPVEGFIPFQNPVQHRAIVCADQGCSLLRTKTYWIPRRLGEMFEDCIIDVLPFRRSMERRSPIKRQARLEQQGGVDKDRVRGSNLTKRLWRVVPEPGHEAPDDLLAAGVHGEFLAGIAPGGMLRFVEDGVVHERWGWRLNFGTRTLQETTPSGLRLPNPSTERMELVIAYADGDGNDWNARFWRGRAVPDWPVSTWRVACWPTCLRYHCATRKGAQYVNVDLFAFDLSIALNEGSSRLTSSIPSGNFTPAVLPRSSTPRRDQCRIRPTRNSNCSGPKWGWSRTSPERDGSIDSAAPTIAVDSINVGNLSAAPTIAVDSISVGNLSCADVAGFDQRWQSLGAQRSLWILINVGNLCGADDRRGANQLGNDLYQRGRRGITGRADGDTPTEIAPETLVATLTISRRRCGTSWSMRSRRFAQPISLQKVPATPQPRHGCRTRYPIAPVSLLVWRRRCCPTTGTGSTPRRHVHLMH